LNIPYTVNPVFVMSLIVLSIPLFFLLIGVELVAARLMHRHLYRLNDAITNLSCGITEQVSGVFAKVATLALYVWLYNHVRLADIPETWYWSLVLLVGFDFCYYWAHRMSHDVNLFWAGHSVHHQSEEYNLSVALRQGAFQKFFTLFFFLPLAVLGFDPVWMIAIGAIDTLYQFWIHTELIDKMGPLEWVMNTPSHHRVHHGRDPKYIDKNHAGIFIVWDRMFGTFQVEEERPTYGITTPLQTWNPVYAQVAHFDQIRHDLARIPGLWDKTRYLFNKPGWLPDALGGYQAPKAVDKAHYQKFDTQVPNWVNWYVFVQYALALGVTSFFLFQYETFPFAQQLSFAAWIFLSCASLGLLFESKRWAWALEAVRILSLVYLAWPFLTHLVQ